MPILHRHLVGLTSAPAEPLFRSGLYLYELLVWLCAVRPVRIRDALVHAAGPI